MISREVFEDIIDDWSEGIAEEHVIHRDMTEVIEKTLGYEEISVIKGVRRAGKTFILYELFQKYKGVYINFEDERLYDFSKEDFEKILDIAKDMDAKFLYLDEVQGAQGWEKFAHRSHRKIKILVTGSNSGLLSSDYSRSLVGRIQGFSIFPLSYPEFLRFRNIKPVRNSLLEYLRMGGFPRIAITGDISLARENFDRIIYRDILGREKVMYPEAVKTLASYLLSNVGKEFSYRSLRGVSGVKHENTVKEYIGRLREAFLVDVINRYHPSLKVQESYGKKVYSIDPSLIALGKRASEDHGRILENIVFLHLRRTHGDIYFGKNGKEVDFIVCEGLKPLKIVNVTYEAEKQNTLQRELSSLSYFQDNFGIPGEIVTLYPFRAPKNIELHLAHRYLMKK